MNIVYMTMSLGANVFAPNVPAEYDAVVEARLTYVRPDTHA